MCYRAVVAALCLAAVSCSRPTPPASLQHLAILRFENLSGDPSVDWMGRAFAEVISRDLAGAPGVYAIPPGRLHALGPAFGERAASAPGVSSERALALAGGADRLGYGEYWRAHGRLETRLTLEDLAGGRTRVMPASGADVTAAAAALARQISGRAVTYGPRNSAALRAYVLGLEAPESQAAAQHFEESISADPDFGPAYTALVRSRVQRRDSAGATALAEQALAHRDRMPELERLQLSLDAASLRGDASARRQALAEWVRITPNDPAAWGSRAEAAMSSHDYTQAVESYQKALTLQPNDAALLNQLGYAAAYAGDLEGALRALRQYEGLRPADANPLDSMGDVSLLFGRLREAENYYLQAVKKDPAFRGGGDWRKAAMARLMGGDITGAGALDQQYVDRRSEARDPLVDYYRAEWLWVSGNRKEGVRRLEEFARRAGNGALRAAAAEAYAELAVWSVALGNRSGAAQLAEKAALGTGPASAGTVAIARFLAQPPAAAAEWAARADRTFPQPAEKPLKERALAYALLADRQFAAASEILRSLYENGGATPDEEAPVLLAWCYLETGRVKEAAGLLRFNVLPASGGVEPFRIFYFPRLFYLRGRVAMLAGQPDAARAQFRLFLQLSGDAPLGWGEEAQAR